MKQLPSIKYFFVNQLTNTNKLSPGMSVEFLVEYKTNTYLDVTETMVFDTLDGDLLEVKLISYRNAPDLLIFMYRDSNILKTKPVKKEEEYDLERMNAVNTNIDCGFCLLGSKINLELILFNEGGRGEFFILTEEEWLKKDIKV